MRSFFSRGTACRRPAAGGPYPNATWHNVAHQAHCAKKDVRERLKSCREASKLTRLAALAAGDSRRLHFKFEIFHLNYTSPEHTLRHPHARAPAIPQTGSAVGAAQT